MQDIKGSNSLNPPPQTIPVPGYNTLIEGYDETISKFGLDSAELRTCVAHEHRRERDDGSVVYYREMHLSIHLLKGVYVKKDATKEDVGRILAESGLDVPVRKV